MTKDCSEVIRKPSLHRTTPGSRRRAALPLRLQQCTGPLETVTAAPVGGASRVVQRYVLPDGRLLHTDPDQTVVQFGFDAVVGKRITGRTNRRGVRQTFAFDAAGKLVAVRVPLTASDTAGTTFCPAESRGFTSTSCSSGPLHPDRHRGQPDEGRADRSECGSSRWDRDVGDAMGVRSAEPLGTGDHR